MSYFNPYSNTQYNKFGVSNFYIQALKETDLCRDS